MKVIVFDDVVFARGETFNLPGLEVHVFEHADDAPAIAEGLSAELVFMDFSMGSNHQSGAEAVRALRDAGYSGKIVAISSDPDANDSMQAAGADEKLAKKALLRSYLAALATAGRVDPT